MSRKFGLEACVETTKQAILAERLGADRIELCSNLDKGGLTPPLDLVRNVRKAISIPIHIMIRPRAGNFIYTWSEIDRMCQQIESLKETGIEGIVMGVLNEQNEIDLEKLEVLAINALPLKVTFHKAIDLVPDIEKAVTSLISFGKIDYVLTSGKAETAWEGREVIGKLVEIAGGKIQIIAAGKITRDNLSRHHESICAPYYHGRNIV